MDKNSDLSNIEFRQRKRWVFFGLPFTFTVYTVKSDLITIEKGFFNRKENDCYMYKVQDVEHTATFFERLFRLGTVVCYTGDNTSPTLELQHIKHAKEIKGFILEASEEARLKRRVLTTMDITSDAEDDNLQHTDLM